MFLRIVKNEWRGLFADKSFLALAAVFAALLGYGVWGGASWIEARQAQSRALVEAQERELAERKEQTARGFTGSTEAGNTRPDPRDPYMTGMGLQHAVLPFTPAAVFSIGQADVLTLDAGVTISTLQRTKADKTGFENPLGFLAGRFDLSFVVVYLLPLFILAMSFNLLSGERERGTLQLLLSQPLTLKKLLTAKLVAQLALMLAALLGVSLAGLLATGTDFGAGSFAARALLWLALVVLYATFWFALAVFVNSFGFTSATNAVVLAACWLVLVLILPSLLNVAVSAAYPMPSRGELVSAIRSVNLDTRRDGARLIAEHYQDHPELMPKEGEADPNNFGLAFVLVQREQKQRVDAVEERFAAQLAAQQSLVRRLRFLSPSAVAQEASNDIAGTGLARYQHFRAQVKEFDREWADYFVPRIFRLEKLSAADFDRIPRFRYREEPTAAVAGRVGPGLLFLLAATAALMYPAFRRLRRVRL
jgi:ABC-2 type transport system permease protein